MDIKFSSIDAESLAIEQARYKANQYCQAYEVYKQINHNTWYICPKTDKTLIINLSVRLIVEILPGD